MFAERIRLACKAGRRPDAPRGLFDAVNVGEPLLDGQLAGPRAHIAFKQGQLTIPPVDSRTDTPPQDLGQEVDQWHQHDQQRNEQDNQALDVGRDEERKIAVQ